MDDIPEPKDVVPEAAQEPGEQPKLSSAGRARMMGLAPETGPEPADLDQVADKRGLTREDYDRLDGGLSNAEKGEIGERAMLADAESQGHEVLMAHPDNPNKGGFDAVMWDPKERRLHIGEAKNYQEGSRIGAEDLSAFEDRHLDANLDEAMRAIEQADESVMSVEDKVSAMQSLIDGNFTTDIYVPKGVEVSDAARERLAATGGDVTCKEYDGRTLWSQERKVRGRSW